MVDFSFAQIRKFQLQLKFFDFKSHFEKIVSNSHLFFDFAFEPIFDFGTLKGRWIWSAHVVEYMLQNPNIAITSQELSDRNGS